MSDHIGHVVYKAAYDVLALHQHELDSKQDGKETSPSQELLESTIDFLSDVVRTAEESWKEEEKGSNHHRSPRNDHRDHRVHRSPRSVPSHGATTPTGFPPVPEVGVSENSFAHEYVPRTGVGNREMIKITGIREQSIKLVIPTPTSQAFRFIRFNSTNHLLSLQRFFVNVWHFHPSHGFHFDHRSSLCQIDSRHEGQVLRAEFFSRIVHHVEKLELVLVIDTPSNGFQLRSYDVDHSGCHPVSIVELKGGPVKVSFVSSHYESATVVLSEGRSMKPRIDISQSTHEHETGSRVIEVSVKNAIDLESFVIDGHSFLAIAYSEGVDIVRLNEFLHHSMLFDSIRVDHITDIVAFQMGFDSFIGISSSGYSQYLYEYRDGSFKIKQIFSVTRVDRWQLIEVPSCREDFILAFIRMDSVYPLLLYLWNGQSRQFLLAVDNLKLFIPSFNYNLIPQSMVSIPFNHTGHLFLLDSLGHPHALSFHTALIPVSDPLFTWTQGTTYTMKNLLNRIHSQELFLNNLRTNLKFAVPTSGPVTLIHPTTFRDLTSKLGSKVHKLNGLVYFALQGSPITLGDLGFHPNEMKQRLSALSTSVSSIQSQLKLMAFKNEPTVMTGKNFIRSAVGHVLNATYLTVDSINGEKVSPLINSIYRAGQSTIIRGKKFFDTLRVERNLNSRVNGIDLKKAMVVDVPQTVTSPITFSRFSVQNNLKVMKVNQIDLKKDLVRIDSGDFVINPLVTITNQEVSISDLTTRTISGVDVHSLSRSVVRRSADQRVLSPLVFNQPLVVKNVLRNRGTNGVDLNQLESDVVRVDRECQVTGRKLFLSDLVLKSEVSVTEGVNGIHIPDHLFLSSLPQTVTGIKRFSGIHTFHAPLTVSSTLSGLHIPSDVITLTGSEPTPPITLLSGIDVFDHVQVTGRVDGVDLSDLSSTVIKASDGTLHNPVFHGPVFVRGSVECTRVPKYPGPGGNSQQEGCSINGIRISSLASDAIMKGSRDPIVITGTKEIRSVFFAPNIETIRVNNIDLNRLASSNKHESISRLILTEVAFNNLTLQSAMIGNVNVMTLHLSHISLSNPGFIESGKNFLDQMVMDDLTVTGTLGSIFPNRDLVLKSGNQVIPGAKTFLQPVSISGSLTVHGHLMSDGLIDGVNVTRLNLLRINLNRQQITRMEARLVNCKTRSIFSPSFNHLDLRRFVPDILLKTTGRQIVTGNKVFKGDSSRSEGGHSTHILNDISSLYGVNGIRLDHVKEKAINLRPSVRNGKVSKVETTVISVPMAFANHFRVGGVALYGSVNGINVEGMVADSLTKAGNCVLTGKSSFLSGLDIVGDLKVGHVNGYFLPSSVFLKTGNQIISGSINFTKVVRSNKNVDIGGKVIFPTLSEGIKFETLDRSIMKVNRPNVVTGDIVFVEDVTTMGDIRVKGSVDGVKVSNLVRRTLLKMFDQSVSGRKKILSPTTSAGSDVGVKYLDDIEFQSFVSDIVFINKENPVEVRSLKKMSRDIFMKRNLAHRDKESVFLGPVNGVSVSSLALSAIALNDPGVVDGKKSFSTVIVSRGDVSVKGRVNGMNLVEDVLFTTRHPSGRNQVVKGKKVFYSVKSLKSIDVKGVVNGVSLPSLARDTLFTKGNQFIQSNKILTGRFIIQNNLLAKRLNSMSDVSTQLVTLKGHQHFDGDIVFAKTLVVGGNVLIRGLISNINMTNLVLHSMYKDLDQTVAGKVLFDRIFFRSDVRIVGPVNGIKLGYLDKEVTSFQSNVKTTNEMIRNLMTNQLKRTTRSYEQLLTNPFKIEKLVLVQELPNVYGESYEYGSVSNGPSFGEQDYWTSNSTVHKLVYNQSGKKWTVLSPLKEMVPKKVIKFPFGKLSLKVNQFPATSEGRTELVAEDKVVATLEPFLDDVHVLVKSGTAFISTLLGIEGKVKVYSLRIVAGLLKLTNIAVINVGPSELITD